MIDVYYFILLLESIIDIDVDIVIPFIVFLEKQNALRLSSHREREYNALPQNLTFLFTSEVDARSLSFGFQPYCFYTS